MAALGLATAVPVAGATIRLADDRPSLVVESEPGAAASPATAQPDQADDTDEQQRIRKAIATYSEAGYDLDYAVELAEVWGVSSPEEAKILKGKFMLGLIDYPGGAETVATDAEIRDGFGDLVGDEAVAERAVRAFDDAGYDYDHAVSLAEFWGMDETENARILKGLFVLGEIDFPGEATFGPSRVPEVEVNNAAVVASADATDAERATAAYSEAGYDLDYAVELAEVWGVSSPEEAKILKGKFMLGLIDYPGGAGIVATDAEIRAGFGQLVDLDEAAERAVRAFDDAGYDYDHAVSLAEFWGMDETENAKILKGLFVLGEVDFPGEAAFGPSRVSEEEANDAAVIVPPEPASANQGE